MKQARDELGFLGIYGDDVRGILVYGLWSAPAQDTSLAKPWPGMDYSEFDLMGPAWWVRLYSVQVSDWPTTADWVSGVYTMLDSLVRAGAKLSWCALDGNFADPPDLFDPDIMGTDVYAALSPSIGFAITCFLDKPLAFLDPAMYARYGQVARDATRPD